MNSFLVYNEKINIDIFLGVRSRLNGDKNISFDHVANDQKHSHMRIVRVPKRFVDCTLVDLTPSPSTPMYLYILVDGCDHSIARSLDENRLADVSVHPVSDSSNSMAQPLHASIGNNTCYRFCSTTIHLYPLQF